MTSWCNADKNETLLLGWTLKGPPIIPDNQVAQVIRIDGIFTSISLLLGLLHFNHRHKYDSSLSFLKTENLTFETFLSFEPPMFKAAYFCLRQSFFQFRKNLFIAGVNFGAAGEVEPTRDQFLAGIDPNHFCFQSSRIFMIFSLRTWFYLWTKRRSCRNCGKSVGRCHPIKKDVHVWGTK